MKPGDLRIFKSTIDGIPVPFIVIDVFVDRYGNRCANIFMRGALSENWATDWLLENSEGIDEAG